LSFWWVDRFLPDLAASAAWATVLFVLHRRMKRHVDSLTDAQTRHIDELTRRQTLNLGGTGTDSDGGSF
jgi:hypothetical protein